MNAETRFLINTRTGIVHYAQEEDGEWVVNCNTQPAKKNSEVQQYMRKKHIRQFMVCRRCLGTRTPPGPADQIIEL
jgi:hypothetical protein